MKCIQFTFWPTDIPDAPGKPDVEVLKADTMMLQWEKPKSDGNTEITHYIVEMQTNNKSDWIQANFVQNVSKESAVITELQEGKTYIFRIAAVNKVGQGSFGYSSTPAFAKSPYGKKNG